MKNRTPVRILLLVVALLSIGMACSLFTPQPPKTIAGAEVDTAFVTDQTSLYFHSPQGVERIRLDGSDRQLIFAGPGLHVQDIAPGWRWFALRNADTDLFIGDATTGDLRPVTQLARRTGEVAFSPDGKTLAASRHADFSLPQAQWQDDDSLYLINIESLAVATLPPETGQFPIHLEWSQDGLALWAVLFDTSGGQWVTLPGGQRQTLPSPPEPLQPAFPPLPGCPAEVGVVPEGNAIQIIDAAGPRALVTSQGNRPDYRDDFSHLAFTPSCEYVIFHFEGSIWLVDVASGRVGPLAQGEWLYLQP